MSLLKRQFLICLKQDSNFKISCFQHNKSSLRTEEILENLLLLDRLSGK